MCWNIRHGGGRRGTTILTRGAEESPHSTVMKEYRNHESGVQLRAGLSELGYTEQIVPPTPANANSLLIASRHRLEKVDLEVDSSRIVVGGCENFALVASYMPNGRAKNVFF